MPTLLDRIFGQASPAPAPEPAPAAPAAPARRRAESPSPQRTAARPKGRQSASEAGNQFPIFAGMWGLADRTDRHREWRIRNLDDETMDRVSTSELIELLGDVSPEVNAALYYFSRFCNPGYEVSALRIGSEEVDDAAQKVLDKFMDELDLLYGSLSVLFDQMFITAFLRGAFCLELVLGEDGAPVDLVIVDPDTIEFRSEEDPVRGPVWVLGQIQDGDFVPLTFETITYVPIDPYPGGAPYGRPLIISSVFVALFLIGMLHDIRRVISQQGYPRIDITVVLERLVTSMPADLQGDPEQIKAWVDAVIDEIDTAYNGLEPDDAFVHTDVVEVNRPVGTMGNYSLGALDELIVALERMIIRSLKTMPLILASNESTTETHANRQWEIHAAGIKSIQHPAETALQRLFKLALESQGVACDVRVRFAELRASEEFRDQQTMAMKITNVGRMYDRGWIGQEEASMMVVGHEPDQEEPRTLVPDNTDQVSNVDGFSGAIHDEEDPREKQDAETSGSIDEQTTVEAGKDTPKAE